ncbi:MAG: response regulator [Desulfobacula sp.]|nr:response regulator [Desulfobacula sp.]
MENINREMKILIVDDSFAMLRIITKFLNNNAFYNLIQASDGVKALTSVQNETIDLIISDLNMPNMNGLELLKIIKEDHRTKHIPFIMLTVEAIQATMNKAISLNVDSYIVKPVAERLFIDEIVRIVSGNNHSN